MDMLDTCGWKRSVKQVSVCTNFVPVVDVMA